MDHMRRGNLKLDGLTALVLDEADEMLRMGFIDDVEWVLEQAPDYMILANGVIVDGQMVINPWERDLQASPAFTERYRLMVTPIEGDDEHLYFYKRVDAPTLPGARPYGN